LKFRFDNVGEMFVDLFAFFLEGWCCVVGGGKGGGEEAFVVVVVIFVVVVVVVVHGAFSLSFCACSDV